MLGLGKALRYAAHLGYRSDRPLFELLAASPDPVKQIAFAAEHGFAGIQYARAVSRTPQERRRVRSALDRHGLEAGCMIYAERETLSKPLWVNADPEARRERTEALQRAFGVAEEIGSRYIAVFTGADPALPLDLQRAAYVENLKEAAELAAARDVLLLIEPLSRGAMSGLLVTHILEGYGIVKAVGSPHVRLVFDTAHVQAMDGDVIRNLRATADAIALVQIADHPGRVEPGAGELNLENVLRVVRELGYRGLVELEFDWSQQSREAEEQGYLALLAMDARLASA